MQKKNLGAMIAKPQVEVVTVERNIQARTDEFIQPTPNVTDLASGVVDVRNNTVIIPNSAIAVITDFINGKNGQTIRVYVEAGISVIGPNIIRTSPDPATKSCILTFTLIEYKWTTLFKAETLIAKWVENYA